MADFGLAAQIGRGGGNAMPGAQPQDQTNRMMQMLQLQQLQQNMMLAREQEARQQQLFGPQLEGKRLENITEGMRQTVLGNQGRRTKVEAEAAEMDQNARRGVVQYLTANSANPRDPKALATLAGANPLAHDELIRRFSETDAIRAKGEKEGALSLQARNELAQAAVANLSWTVDAVQNANEFQTLRRSLVGLDPTAADYIPEKFDGRDGEAMRRLRLRLGAWKDTAIEEDASGRKYLVNKRTGGRRYLPEPETAAAQTPPPAVVSPFGSSTLTEPAFGPGADAATFEAARAFGAGVAPYIPPGETPIIQPRTPAPGLGPAATAAGEKATATERAKADVERAEKERDKTIGRESFDKTFRRFVDQYKEMGRQGTLITEDSTIGQRIKTFAAAQAPGVAGVIDPKMAAPIQTLQNLRQAMVASLIAANPGMSSKSIDSNAELKSYLDSLTTPGQSVNTIVDTMNALSEKYGSGKQVTVEDIVGKSAERAPAGRGRAAPAAARGAPSVEDLLKKYQ